MSMAGVKLIWSWRVISFGTLLVVYAALSSCGPTKAIAAPDPIQTTVKITNSDPRVKIAIARVIGTDQAADLYQGKLELESCDVGKTISVWAPGYYIKSFLCNEIPPHEYLIELEPINPFDNPTYPWVAANISLNPGFECSICHSDGSLMNEFPEWNRDGHSQAFLSPLFWTTYLGTDINKAPAQQSLWGFSPDGSRHRLPADANQPDHGPGYRLDFPDAGGNCAFCHVPAAIGANHQEVDLTSWINDVWGGRMNVATEGVTCDVCHKVIDVDLDGQKLPYLDRPGILSFSFLRPSAGEQHVVGPWAHLLASTTDPDIKRACAPIFSESSFCAPCHYAKFSGVEIYASYKEWLDSPYSQPNQSFRACQDCHMQSLQPVGKTTVPDRGACSKDNYLFQDFSHNMMNRDNTGDPILIQGAATVSINAIREDGNIRVNVNVVNTKAGHKLPTDSPLRHLILVVEAKDQNGVSLGQVAGPTIPEWGGTGNGAQDYAGRPGVIYANLLKDKDTSMVPAVAYWNPTVPAWQGSDTRLLPNQDTLSEFFFVAPSQGGVTVTAQLFYRYAFIDILHNKGLQPDDILVNWGEAKIP